MCCSIEYSVADRNRESSISTSPEKLNNKENQDEYEHRLVQDENAKTILLNVPLEINSTLSGKFCTLCSPDKWLNTLENFNLRYWKFRNIYAQK